MNKLWIQIVDKKKIKFTFDTKIIFPIYLF